MKFDWSRCILNYAAGRSSIVFHLAPASRDIIDFIWNNQTKIVRLADKIGNMSGSLLSNGVRFS